MIVLGIETSCDETAASVVKDGQEILSNVVFSQIELHKKYGGVVPELASRSHIELIMPVVDQALKEAQVELNQIDLFAATYGPGLMGALLIGMNTAKGLALTQAKPFIGINHVEAHLYAAMMSNPGLAIFPCLGVVLSGGHTALLLIHEIGSYTLIGQTIDDAIGEAFDKVAKMMGLSYPGGPMIEQLALQGNPDAYAFKSGHIKGREFDFSFSGLKTAVLYKLKGQNKMGEELQLNPKEQSDLAASFQQAALRDVVKKALAAADKFQVNTLLFGGGVTHNRQLRKLFLEAHSTLTYLWPSAALTLDNAAMIAGLGCHHYKRRGRGDSFALEPLTRIPFHS